MRKYIVPAIGVAAFVVGGYFTRAKALDTIETIEDRLAKDRKKPVETPSEDQ